MEQEQFVYTISLIFISAAIVATLALYARQALLVAYILVGSLMGPWVLGLINDARLISQIGHTGIVFLLFLLGLHLKPRDLLQMAGKITVLTLISSVLFFIAGVSIPLMFGFSLKDSLWIAGTLTFSSTIISIKLLPTTVLHHQRTGDIIISILLLQDLFAILALLFLHSSGPGGGLVWIDLGKLLLSFPALILLAWVITRYLLITLINNFDRIHEFIFLLAIAWCLGMAEIAHGLGLSHEIGAFVGGVALATNPISLYIAERLKPLRDFFLILFFFSLGAGFNLTMIPSVWLPALVLALAALVVKPPVYYFLFKKNGESEKRAKEIGFRLGQMSEFSLLIAVLALQANVISAEASYMIQLSTIVTFLISTYIVVLRFPTPIALSDRLRLD